LAFELLEMNLRDAIKEYGKGKGLGLDYVRSFAQQIFKALYHMRKHRIIHADIKPDNILIS
jgi:serine/threonine-protein kinase PRP4